MRNVNGWGLAISFVLLSATWPSPATSQTVDWIRQLGTSSWDDSCGVSADGLGNVYISGWTGGDLGGPSADGLDAFVSKYNDAGVLQWTRQLGTSMWDESWAVSADGLGNVYISGATSGDLGGPNAGESDAFVSKYDAAGNLQWTRQLGTDGDDYGHGVSSDGLGNVYISGRTSGDLGGPNAGGHDAFVGKYDAAGTRQWTRQLGTLGWDVSFGVSADGLGNVYISGYTGGDLGGPSADGLDAFVSKYNDAGVLQWTRQLGTMYDDISYGVSADGLGNVYISGRTAGDLGGPNAGSCDAFISKYDDAGVLQWTRQLGTEIWDESRSVSANGLGNVCISGYTDGGLGTPDAGPYDAFVSEYDAEGTLQWTCQLGSGHYDKSCGVSVDGTGNVYVSGYTYGDFGGASARTDAFVARISEIPEPSAALLALAALVSLAAWSRPRENRNLTLY